MAKLLLENGANTDFQDTSGLTALMISSLLWYFNIVQLLIVEYRARVDLKQKDGGHCEKRTF